MKPLIIALATVLLASPLSAQEKSASPAQPAQLKDLKDKVSYSIGLNIGLNFRKQKMDLNPDALVLGVKDALANRAQMTPEQVKETMTAFEKEMMEKQKTAGEKNKADGEKFLAENKSKEGIKTTPSGLQFKVLKEGTGPSPKETDTVTVNYRGTLIDGTEFDSSYKRGEPATFPLNGVIKGWTEGVQLIKKGGKTQLFIPAALAYGERAMPPDIGASSTLIFEIELMDVKPGAAAASPSPATK
jgi:FKBP-type peptidyl-prolyl cis-trans isomerase FklB